MILRLCRLCLAITIPVLALVSAPADAEADQASEASVYFSINPRGDVKISIYADDLTRSELEGLRKILLPCNWRAERSRDDSLAGTCRDLLSSDGASVDGRMPVAGLVMGLRAAGMQTVKLSVEGFAPFRSSPGEGWYTSQKGRGKAASKDTRAYYYTSQAIFDVPLRADIHVGVPWKASQFVTPLAFTLLGPPLLAMWLRRRGARKGERTATVWMHWVLNGMFLYWISALSISDLTAFTFRLHLDSAVATLAIGVLVYSIPPLAAVMVCVFLTQPGDNRREAATLAGRAAIQNATFLVPLGIFLVGSSMLPLDPKVAMGSLLATYAAYKMLLLAAARATHGNIQKLSHGDLFHRSAEIAVRAGVKLEGLYLTENRSRREANAFASGTGVVILSRGLVENLTRREVDGVLAHETGHLRGKHVLLTAVTFWAYILLIQPVAMGLAIKAGVLQWMLTLPILPLAYILGTAFLSRGREFNADQRAAELTGDPLGVIAGLARLRRLTDSPVDWGGMQGSILSHPSMQARVLAIARHFHVDETRALAVLHDPDILGAEPAPAAVALVEAESAADEAAPFVEIARPLHYQTPERSVLFSSFAKEGHAFRVRWIMNVVLVSELFALAIVLEKVEIGWLWGVLAFLAGIALTVRTFLSVDEVLSCRFLKRIRRRLEGQRGVAESPAMFVGVLPGERVLLNEGYAIWDVGFLSLSPDFLTYEGEQTRFSVPRAEITGVTVQKGPLAWDPVYAVTVAWQGGAFNLTRPDRGTTSRRQARRLEALLVSWWRGEPQPEAVPGAASRLPAPTLPLLPESVFRGWKAVRVLALRAVMLFLGVIILLQALDPDASAFVIGMTPVLAPVCYVLAVCPLVFRKAPAV